MNNRERKENDPRIAIARITGFPDKKGCHPVSLGGDGLASLSPPFRALLYRPSYTGNDLTQILKTARQGPNPNGPFYPIEILSFRLHHKKARICLSITKGVQKEIATSLLQFDLSTTKPCIESNQLDLFGMWICVHSSQLCQAIKDDEYFVYELLGLPVFQESAHEPASGKVTDFLETGAHGVIEIRLSQNRGLVMVPMIGEYVHFTEDRLGLLIPRLGEFLEL